MALEKRDGNLYYYRSVRDGERYPKKVYVGAGEFGRIAPEQDTIRRTAQEGERERQRAEVERLGGPRRPAPRDRRGGRGPGPGRTRGKRIPPAQRRVET
jgi:hypothetical protein